MKVVLSKNHLIKNKNRKWLITYILFHIVLFALFTAIISPTFENINLFLSKLKSPAGFFPLLAFPIVVVLEGLIHSNHKAILMFWRIKNPLPGCRAFTQIAPNDPRIRMSILKKMFPDGLPTEPCEQNAAWYGIYRQHQNKPIVYDAHRFFLLSRDLAALTVILIPFCVVAHIFWSSPASIIVYHSLTLVMISVLTCISSIHYGKRLVENVFVEAITEKERNERES